MNPEDLKRRTQQFALRILKLVVALPNTVQGRTVADNWFARELPSDQITEQHVAVDQRQNLSQGSA